MEKEKTTSYWTLGCGCCGGVLLGKLEDEHGNEMTSDNLELFPSKELAQLQASELTMEGGEQVPVLRIEVKVVERI